MSGLIKHSFSLAGHRTSVALEPEFWDALWDIARARGLRRGALVAQVDAARDGTTTLASALRVVALRNALRRAAERDSGPPTRPLNLTER